MTEGPYVLGIDYGTGGCRVGIFDPDGNPAVFHSVEFATSYPRSAWAEQDPDTWWSSLVTATRGALDESGVSPDAIAGIGVDTTTATVLAIGADDRPLRPAIMWMDIRAAEQARRMEQTGDPALKVSGYGAVSAEWGTPKALWLKEKEPETFRAATRIVEAADWLTHRLTGEWTGSVNLQTIKYFYDRDEGGYPERFYDAFGGADLLEKLPQNVLDLGVVAGTLRADVAEELGLKAGTPVAEGGADAYMGALGLGLVEPGKMAFITGSSHVMIGQSAEPIHGQGFWGTFTDAMIPGQYTIEAGQASTGSVVAWFKNNFGGHAIAEGQKRGIDPYVVLGELAREVPPGSDGLVVLDYFQGNRSPYTDSSARGVITGLSLAHGPGHVFRAILEGICYGSEHIFRTFRSQGFEPTEILVSGGPTKSDLWMQMHADVSNVPITLTKVTEGPVLGSAILAAAGAGIHPSVADAARAMVTVERTVEPDAARHEEYRFYVDKYIETYPLLREVIHEMVQHTSGSGVPAPSAEGAYDLPTAADAPDLTEVAAVTAATEMGDRS